MAIQTADSLLLQTRKKWNIPNELRPERNKASLQAAIEIAKGLCPDAILRSITNVYNCGGMVAASRRAWVFPEDFVKILTDDGYRRLASANQAEGGDVVIYHDDEGNPSHIAVVVRKNLAIPGELKDILTVLSKWGGDGGEYIHEASKLPAYLGRPAQYWTDRRSP